jgi:hypothetical protein
VERLKAILADVEEVVRLVLGVGDADFEDIRVVCHISLLITAKAEKSRGLACANPSPPAPKEQPSVSISETDADVDAETGLNRVDCEVAVASWVVNDCNLSVIPVVRDGVYDLEVQTVVPEVRTETPAGTVPATMTPEEAVIVAPVGLEELVVEMTSVPVSAGFTDCDAPVVADAAVLRVKLLIGLLAIDVIVAHDSATLCVVARCRLRATVLVPAVVTVLSVRRECKNEQCKYQ